MEQNKLPTKTKIAAWWMIIFGIMGIIGTTFGFIGYAIFGRGTAGSGETALLALLPVFIVGLPLLILGILISKRKKWAWILTLAIFILLEFCMWALKGCCTVDFLGFQVSLPYNVFLLVLVPFILLLLDRKNFFKIAS